MISSSNLINSIDNEKEIDFSIISLLLFKNNIFKKKYNRANIVLSMNLHYQLEIK